MSQPPTWTVADARTSIRRPTPNDHKYSRGVVGMLTGSAEYPGAAVLGVGAALRTGVGMVRYAGPTRCQDLVLQRYPEALIAPGDADVWVIGSGHAPIDPDATKDDLAVRIHEILSQNIPVVLDAGALSFAARASTRNAPTILTPHAGELARLLECRTQDVLDAPVNFAARAAAETGAFVLLKGHTTTIAAPDSTCIQTIARTTWLATGGTGDALAGILGALLTVGRHRRQSTRSLLRLIASANVLHAESARCASMIHGGVQRATDGPITVIDLLDALPLVLSQWLDAQS